MKIKGTAGAGAGGNKVEQEAMEEGTYPARLVQVVHMGTQPQRPFKGQPKPDADSLMVTYEFLDEFIKDEEGNEVEDKPRWLSEDFPLKSMDLDKAKSTIRYKVFDPKGEHDGDWAAIISHPCMATVGTYKKNDGTVRNKILSIAPMRDKDIKNAPELKNPPKIFSVSDPDTEVLGSLPQWLQDKINGSPEMSGSKPEEQSSDEEEGSDTPW